MKDELDNKPKQYAPFVHLVSFDLKQQLIDLAFSNNYRRHDVFINDTKVSERTHRLKVRGIHTFKLDGELYTIEVKQKALVIFRRYCSPIQCPRSIN